MLTLGFNVHIIDSQMYVLPWVLSLFRLSASYLGRCRWWHLPIGVIVRLKYYSVGESDLAWHSLDKVNVTVRTVTNCHLPTTMVVPLCTQSCLLLLKVRSGRNLRDNLGLRTYSNLVSPCRILGTCNRKCSRVTECLSCLFNKIQRESWHFGGLWRVKPLCVAILPYPVHLGAEEGKRTGDGRGTLAFPTPLFPQRTQKVVAKSTLFCTHSLSSFCCAKCVAITVMEELLKYPSLSYFVLTALLYPQLSSLYKNKLILWTQENNVHRKCKSIASFPQCVPNFGYLSVPSTSWPKPALTPRSSKLMIPVCWTVFTFWNQSVDIWLRSSLVVENHGSETKHYPVCFMWLWTVFNPFFEPAFLLKRCWWIVYYLWLFPGFAVCNSKS